MLNAAAKKARSAPPLFLQLDTQNKRPSALAPGANAGTIMLGLTTPSTR